MERKEYNELQNLFEKEGQSTSWNIANVIRGNGYIDKATLVAAAYVLLLSTDENADLSSVQDFCASLNLDEDRESFLESYLSDSWQILAGIKGRYSSNVLRAIIIFYEDRDFRFGIDGRTPESITKLANKLFGYSENDNVADFGIGSAAFVTETHLTYPTLSFYGNDINATTKELAAIKLEILGCKIDLECCNIFDMDSDAHKFDKIFANYPFGLRAREFTPEKNALLQKILDKMTGISRSVSSDWLFNSAVMECLNDNGTAIAVMTNGSTWNTIDRSARQYFVENGFLQAVIALPERMFDNTNIPTTMVVLSRNNEKTMLVDATNLCEKGRRINTFTDDSIDTIASAAFNEGEYSKVVSIKELQDNDYVINPTRYLTPKTVIENGIPFADCIKRITRGAPINASELDTMVSDKPTCYQYLMLKNIQKDQIDAELPYLTGIADNLKKYCIKDRSLILSKNGAPFKIAVAEVEEGKEILANGNLFVIEIDETIADPYFIKAFLESEKGIAILKSITVGATIPNIGVESLKKIMVPNVPIEKQREVVANYRAKIDEISLCKRKLEKLYNELNHFYDNEEWN